MKKQTIILEDDDKYPDISILEVLYKLGEQIGQDIKTYSPDAYPLGKEDGYTAREICEHIGRSWYMPYDVGSHEFCINVGTFCCKASYSNVFGLIMRFEKICKKSGKKRHKFFFAAK